MSSWATAVCKNELIHYLSIATVDLSDMTYKNNYYAWKHGVRNSLHDEA